MLSLIFPNVWPARFSWWLAHLIISNWPSLIVALLLALPAALCLALLMSVFPHYFKDLYASVFILPSACSTPLGTTFLCPSPSQSVPVPLPNYAICWQSTLPSTSWSKLAWTIIHAKHLADAHEVFCKEPIPIMEEASNNCILNYVWAISLYFEGILLSLHKTFQKLKSIENAMGIGVPQNSWLCY